MISRLFFIFCLSLIIIFVHGISNCQIDNTVPLRKNCKCKNSKWDYNKNYILCMKNVNYCTDWGCSTRPLDPDDADVNSCAIWPDRNTEPNSKASCICNNKYICHKRDICSEYFGCLPSVNVKYEKNNFKKDPNFDYNTHIHIKTTILLRNPPEEIKNNITDIIRKYYPDQDLEPNLDQDLKDQTGVFAYSLQDHIENNAIEKEDYKDDVPNVESKTYQDALYKNNRDEKKLRPVQVDN